MSAATQRCSQCRLAAREIAWSEAAKALLCRRCYERLPTAQYQEPDKPPVKLLPPKPLQPSAYTRFVYRIWDRVTERTGQEPTYLDHNHVAIHCPRCGDGTLRLTFVKHPEPRALITSNDGGPGRCSMGCTEDEIIGALFG